MKVFFTLIKIIIVGLFWSVFFFEGIRVILYQNWRFDILDVEHWMFLRDVWLSGWIVNKAREWAFILILLTSIPLWLTGWAALCMIKYTKTIKAILGIPFGLFNKGTTKKRTESANKKALKKVAKKKSHKEIRPPARDGSTKSKTEQDIKNKPAQQRAPVYTAPVSNQPAKKSSSSIFEHSLFEFDDEDEGFSFDLDAPIEKPAKKQPAKKTATKPLQTNKTKPKKEPSPRAQTGLSPAQPRSQNNSIAEVIKQQGYDFISSVSIKNNVIDFVGFSKDSIVLFLVDKEHGDWLADEEKFNGEEPLWFSESSHRISPVRRVDAARDIIADRLENTPFAQKIEAYVINQMNNIINAEDMFEVWHEMDIKVTRIDRGTPKELPLFAKTLEEAEEKVSKEDLEKLKKIFRGIN